NGSRLKTAPSSVTLTFDEPVGLGGIGYLHVVDSNGKRVDVGSAFHPAGSGSKVATKLKAGLGDGTYTESFRIISADSHPVAGTVRFVVGNGVLSTTPIDTSTVNGGVSFTFDVTRWLSYAGLATLGGAWLVLTAWPQGRTDRAARRLLWTGLGATTFGAALETLLQGPYTAGTSLGELFRWTLLDTTLHTDYGRYHCIRLLALGLAAVYLSWALQRGRSRVDLVAVPIGLTIALSFSADGHAATTSPDWLSITADLLHVSAVATWIGGLVMLVGAVLRRDDSDEATAVLPVMSRVALVAVCTIAATGLYAAWRGIGSLDAIFATNYGLIVVIKVLIFLTLLALGYVSRRVVQGKWAPIPVAYAHSDTGTTDADLTAEPDRVRVEHERLRRSVVVEVVLALVVLGATGVLVSEPRGKEALAIEHQKPASATAQVAAGRTVTVTVDPDTHGTVSVSAELSKGPAAQRLTGTASLPSKQLGPIPLGLTASGPNSYGASGVQLPSSGTWVFELVVTTSEFAATTVDVKLHLY
ncbi:MAG TPA: CopD family protein, partial [Jatrophihabitantaceae bacterium]|nr:CopD family protein [Jatrophihabitantaceae bacterium]